MPCNRARPVTDRNPIQTILAAAVRSTDDPLVKKWFQKLLRDGRDAAGDVLTPKEAAEADPAAK